MIDITHFWIFPKEIEGHRLKLEHLFRLPYLHLRLYMIEYSGIGCIIFFYTSSLLGKGESRYDNYLRLGIQLYLKQKVSHDFSFFNYSGVKNVSHALWFQYAVLCKFLVFSRTNVRYTYHNP